MTDPGPYRLRPVVQAYDWGSTTALADLLGVASDGGPQAELWFGGHPAAPSEALVGGEWRRLDRLVADDDLRCLGPAVVERFGARLPFLFKVLAAARPLSLQVHPSLAQAREGYAREEAAAIPRRAPHRTYRDRNHKPELLVALTPFDALSGFRAPEASAELFSALIDGGARALRPWRDRLAEGDLGGCFWALWDLDPGDCGRLVAEVVAAGRRLAAGGPTGAVEVDPSCDGGPAAAAGPWSREAGWAARLGDLHPLDPGVVVALLLNLVRLQPGEGLYAPAGRLHAYLEGVGLEVMASSDNVVRGGLTTKHVDLAELEHVLAVQPEVPDPLRGRAEPSAGTAGGPTEVVWDTPTPEFRLSRLDLGAGDRAEVRPRGPEVLLCLEGVARLGDRALERGQGAFVPASLPYEATGPATVWRATVGDVSQFREPERRRRSRRA